MAKRPAAFTGMCAMIEIRRVLVISAGILGSQIAMICALAGLEVGVQDVAKVGARRRFGS